MSRNTDRARGNSGPTDPRTAHERITTSRRAFLTASAAGLTSLSGCSGILNRSTSEPTDTPEPRPDGDPDREPRNAILMIPDGTSSAHLSAARYLKAYQADPDAFPHNIGSDGGRLAVDDAPGQGQMSTFPDDPDYLITDSAAAGTALASGKKTYNGAIGGVDTGSEFQPVETILEKAYQAGMATGLVTTTAMTHATPAAFASHVADRGEAGEIATQYVESGLVDVLLGGGREPFADRDLIGEAEDKGYSVIGTGKELANASGRVLGLFGSDVSRTSHMSYYLDRLNESGNTEPLLDEMVERAISILSSTDHGRENGFFLMVESGRVDHLGHRNDPAIAAEQLEADDAFRVALKYVQDDSEHPTTLVQAPDHETGGLSIGFESKHLNWETLAGMTGTTERLASSGEDPEQVIGVEFSDGEREEISEDPEAVRGILNERARTGWSTGNHTGESVPVSAVGEGAERVTGHFDNTDLAPFLADVLEIEPPNGTKTRL